MHRFPLDALSFISYGWLVFALYWAVSALRVKRMKYVAPIQVRMIQLVFLVPGGYLLFVRHTGVPSLQLPVLPESAAVAAIGVVLAWGGIAFAIWARYVLGSNWSSQVAIRENHELIQAGPYRFIRHPIYTGIIIATLGTAIALGQLGAFVGITLIIVGLAYKGKQEELRLHATFGDSWDAHRQRTGMFLPRMR